jgi:hypothetical protein
MMVSKREQVLQALFDRLSGVAGPKVLRNEVLPERIPGGGIVILRDGDPGEPDVLLSPPEYVYAHRADIEVVVDGPTPAARDGIFDSIMLSIGAAIASDRTLGGLCDYIEAVAPEPIDLAVEGAPGLKAAVMPIILHYGSFDPLS